MNDRPNILWIQTDEQRPDSLGCMGSAWARTPHLDALAARGVVFRNCVCQSPVCAPSRTSQMTSRYPQEVGVLFNDGASGANPLAQDAITFPAVLEDAGYETVSFGKTHLPPMRCWSRDDQLMNLDEYADFYKLGPGYDKSAYQVVTRAGMNQVILAGVYPGGDDHPSKRITDWAIDYLHQRPRQSDKPFLLRVSHNWPHTPVLVPPPFDTLYDPDELPIRYFDEEAYRRRSAYDRRIADAMRMRELTREQTRLMWSHYMGLCACVDHEAGRLLAVLRELDMERNTIVVFSSDHGKALGEWGAGEKCQFDDAVWRVPMIWSFPQLLPQGEVRHDVCELLDTGHTLLSLLGMEEQLPEVWRGRNLFGDPEPDAVFGQIGWPGSDMPLLDDELMRKAHERCLPAMEGGHPFDQGMRVGVRTRDLAMDVTWMRDGGKLVGDDLDGNLFDLRTDPATRDNRYHDPAFADVRHDLLDKLDRWQSSLEAPPTVFG